MSLRDALKKAGEKALDAAQNADQQLGDGGRRQSGRGLSATSRKGNRLLTVVQAEDGDWLVKSDNGRNLSRHRTKQAAVSAARQRAANSDQFNQFQVLRPNARSTSELIEQKKEFLGERGGSGRGSGSLDVEAPSAEGNDLSIDPVGDFDLDVTTGDDDDQPPLF